MNPFQNNRESIDDPVACVIMFILIIGLLLLVAKLKHYYLWQIVYSYLFFLGRFSWTFLEYMFHRFAWHSKRTNKADFQSGTFNRLYHRQLLTEIRITKSETAVKRWLVVFTILLSSHFCSSAQEKLFHYDVLRNGNVIGYLNLTEKTKGNIVFLELKSEVKTRLLLFSYSSYVKEDVIFEDGIMIYSFYYKRENGKESSVEAKKSDGYLNVVDNGNTGSRPYTPVRNNILQLYFISPVMNTKAYSNHFQQFLDIKKIAENRYRLTLPDNNYNYFNYKNGECAQVDIERTFFTIHFVLRN